MNDIIEELKGCCDDLNYFERDNCGDDIHQLKDRIEKIIEILEDKKLKETITLEKKDALWLLKSKNLNKQEIWDALLKVTLSYGKAVGFSESDILKNCMLGLSKYDDFTSKEVK